MSAKINYSLVVPRKKAARDPRKAKPRDPRLARRVAVAAAILLLLLLILAPVSCNQSESRYSTTPSPRRERTIAQAVKDEARDLKTLFQLVGMAGEISSGPPTPPSPKVVGPPTPQVASTKPSKHPAKIRKENDGEIWLLVPP